MPRSELLVGLLVLLILAAGIGLYFVVASNEDERTARLEQDDEPPAPRESAAANEAARRAATTRIAAESVEAGLSDGGATTDTGFPVSGRVVQAANREPVAGAEIVVTRAGSAAVVTSSDERGRFTFDVVLEPDTSVHARLGSMRSRSVALARLDAPDVHVGDLVIWIEEGVHGRIIGPTGAPIVGATIIAFRVPDFREDAGFWSGVTERCFAEPEGERSVLTDTEGAFVIDELREGRYVLRVESAGMALAHSDLITLDPAAATSAIEIQLAEATLLSGRVIDAVSGRAVPGAEVVALDEIGAVVGSASFTRSDDDGRFTLAASSRRPLHVLARAAGYGIGGSLIDTQAPPAAIVLKLDAGFVITGRVHDADTLTGLAGASIVVWGMGLPTGATSAADGTFSVPLTLHAAASKARLDVKMRGYVVASGAPGASGDFVAIHPDPADRASLVCDVGMRPAATISGVVVDDATGAPIVGARVRACRTSFRAAADDGRGSADLTDASGAFTLTDVAPVDVHFDARHPEYAPLKSLTGLDFRSPRPAAPDLTVAYGESVTGIVLRMRRGRSIAGKVIDAQGAAVVGARVELAPAGGRVTTVHSGLDGRFRSPPLGATETITLTARHPEYPEPARATVPTDVESTEVTLILTRPVKSTLRGRVLLPGGAPAVGVSLALALVPSGGPLAGRIVPTHTVSVADDGSYRFDVNHVGEAELALDRAGTAAGLRDVAMVPAVIRLDLVAGEDAIQDVRLVRAPAIAGRVLLPDGEPAIGWTVQLRAQDADGGRLAPLVVRTDASGSFRAPGLREGVPYHLLATGPTGAAADGRTLRARARDITAGDQSVTLVLEEERP